MVKFYLHAILHLDMEWMIGEGNNEVDIGEKVSETVYKGHCCPIVASASRVAQWERAGPITQRSMDRNHPLLVLFSIYWEIFYRPYCISLPLECLFSQPNYFHFFFLHYFKDSFLHLCFLFFPSPSAGYLPKMELYSMRPSSVMENGTQLNTTKVEWNPDEVEWNVEIPIEEAKAALERAMYPFKKV